MRARPLHSGGALDLGRSRERLCFVNSKADYEKFKAIMAAPKVVVRYARVS